MSDVHRNICQILLDQGIQSEDDLLDLFYECLERHAASAKAARLKRAKGGHEADGKDRKTLAGVIDHINGQLEPLGLKVARMKSKSSGELLTYYGLVNLNEDDAFGKLAASLTKPEQEYFHLVITQILESDAKRLEAMAATNARHEAKETSKLSNSDANKCLERLELGQWLAKSDDGYYSLGVRTELQRRYMSAESATEAGATGKEGAEDGEAAGPTVVD